MNGRPLSLRTNSLANPELAGALDAVLGSLPMSYRRTPDSENPDVIVVGGPDWAGQLAAATAGSATSGIRGVLIVDPWPWAGAPAGGPPDCPVDCPVVVDTGWRHNPAVDQIAEGVARFAGPGAVLRVRSTSRPGSDLARSAIGMLDLVGAVAAEPAELVAVRQDDRHLVLDGWLADGTALVVTVVASNAVPADASLSIGGRDGRARLELPDPATAAAATATVTDSTGHTTLPVGNESARRGALKRLAAAIVDGAEHPDDLRRLLAYAPLLVDAIRKGPGSMSTIRNNHDGRAS